MFTPSINIYPDSIGVTRSKDYIKLDFPHPVLPATPIFSFASILNEMFLSTKGVSSR